jgi:hypothetical protein
MAAIGADYVLMVYTPAWVGLGMITEFTRLSYVRAVNAPGELRVSVLDVDVPFDRLSLTRDGRVDMMRSVPGNPAVLETETIWLITSVTYRQITRELEIVAQSAMTLLARRLILGAPESAAADKLGAADTIITSYVSEAMGSLASTERQIATLTVNAARGTGPAAYYQGSLRSLLSAIQDIAGSAAQDGTPVYADVIFTSGLQFVTYVGTRGTDRSSTSRYPLVFSEDRDNLIDATVVSEWDGERNVVYVQGAGQGASQTMLIVASERATSSAYSRTEMTVNAGQTKDAVIMQYTGQSELWKARPRKVISGSAISVETCQYGIHWGFGDAVVVEVDGLFYDARIDSLSVTVDNGDEKITAGFRAEDDL